MFTKKQKVLFFIVILVFVILLVPRIPQVTTTSKTAGLWINMAIPEGNWRPLDLFTPAPVLEKYSIESQSLRTLILHLYIHVGNYTVVIILLYSLVVGWCIHTDRLVI